MSVIKRIAMDPALRRQFKLSVVPKEMFLDRMPVLREMDRVTNTAMIESGKMIRRRAQTSMRYVTSLERQQKDFDSFARKRPPKPYRPSQPGQPPVAVRPHPWVRKHIYYSYNRQMRNVVIGPTGFARGSAAPHNLEFGGRVRIKNIRRTHRSLGDGGEVRLGGKIGKTSKPAVNQRGMAVMVTYALLRTQKMVDRANRINAELYGTDDAKTVSMAARPFMGPALAAENANIPKLWHNSIRG